MRFIEAKCVAGKVKPPEENGLALSHWTKKIIAKLSTVRRYDWHVNMLQLFFENWKHGFTKTLFL